MKTRVFWRFRYRTAPGEKTLAYTTKNYLCVVIHLKGKRARAMILTDHVDIYINYHQHRLTICTPRRIHRIGKINKR